MLGGLIKSRHYPILWTSIILIVVWSGFPFLVYGSKSVVSLYNIMVIFALYYLMSKSPFQGEGVDFGKGVRMKEVRIINGTVIASIVFILLIGLCGNIYKCHSSHEFAPIIGIYILITIDRIYTLYIHLKHNLRSNQSLKGSA